MSPVAFPSLYATALVRGEVVRVISQSAKTRTADLQLLVQLGDGSQEWVAAADVRPVF